MREKYIEQKLIKEVKAAGGVALKFISPGYNGVPDRLILLPGGIIAFAEIKASGSKPRPIQKRRHEMLRQLGFKVYVIDSDIRKPGWWCYSDGSNLLLFK